MKNKFALIALLLIGALLLSACTVNMHTKIKADGSGDWITEIGFTAEDEQSLTQMGYASVDAYCNEAAADMPDEATATVEVRGDETYCVYTVPFASLDELRMAYTDSDGVIVNRLEIVDGTLYYDITVEGGTGDLGSMGITSNWIVTMPGSIQNHNAPIVEGNQLTWTISAAGTTNIQAQSKVGGISSDVTTYLAIAGGCLCCLVIVIIIVVVVFLVMRKRKAAQPPTPPEIIPPAI